MITINSGKLIIPEEERFIGFTGDNLHLKKQFLVENVCDENCIYRLYLEFDDGTVNYFVLDSKVENGSTILTWNIEEKHIFKSGLINAQIKSISDSGTTHHSSWNYFFAAPSAEFSGEFANNENSEFLRYEKTLNEIYNKISETNLGAFVTEDRTIAGFSLSSNITSEELCDSLSVYPTILKEGVPTALDNYVGRYLIDTSNNDLYYCNKRTLSGSNWIKLTDNTENPNSINKAEINENGELVLTFTDDTICNLGRVVGADGKDGTDGTTPVKGIDYFTEKDKKTLSPLYGKKIVYDGDSICFGGNASGGYAKIIAEKAGTTFDNQSQGGARLTTAVDNATYHSVVDNLSNLPTDGDLYCFEGGINDYWTPKTLGSFTKDDFTGELDTNTICGALETIFRYALNTFVGKPICFIITHKIQNTAYRENANGDTFEDYHNAMVGICEKYSIPYYDAFSNSGLNGWNTAQNNAFLTANSEGTPDGCHPNEEGYKRYYVPQLISLFERIMPKDVTQTDEPSYTNVLDDVGYTKGIYLSSGNESTDANAYTTGYIPCMSGSTIYLKNISMPDESSHGNRIGLYNADKSVISGYPITSSVTASNPVFDDNGNLTQFYIDHGEELAYIRVSAWLIDETSIITVNEPIS